MDTGEVVSVFQPSFLGFDELFEMDIKDSSVLAGDYSFGDHRSSSGAYIASDIESRTPGRLGGTEKGLGDRVMLL